jgi:hypothetical protein
MRFTVTWHPSSERELANVWMRSNSRSGVSQAANLIDRALASDPLHQGEEFYGDRLLVVLPLAVTYTVSVADRSVQILQVWHVS